MIIIFVIDFGYLNTVWCLAYFAAKFSFPGKLGSINLVLFSLKIVELPHFNDTWPHMRVSVTLCTVKGRRLGVQLYCLENYQNEA